MCWIHVVAHSCVRRARSVSMQCVCESVCVWARVRFQLENSHAGKFWVQVRECVCVSRLVQAYKAKATDSWALPSAVFFPFFFYLVMLYIYHIMEDLKHAAEPCCLEATPSGCRCWGGTSWPANMTTSNRGCQGDGKVARCSENSAQTRKVDHSFSCLELWGKLW